MANERGLPPGEDQMSTTSVKELQPAYGQLSQRSVLSRYLGPAAAVIVSLALGIGVWLKFFHQSEVERGLAALARAYRAQRPIEARISGLDFGSLAQSRGESKVDEIALNQAERILLDEIVANPSASASHALGRFYLAKGNFEAALNLLEQAANGDPENADLHNDLAAAHLERAVSISGKVSLFDLARSLEESNRAIQQNGSQLDAWFNRALCLQKMKAPTPAIEAWQQYLEKDPHSLWSKEAEDRLELLRARINRGGGPDEVYQEFLKAFRAGDRARAWQIQSETKEMITGTMIPFQLVRSLLAAKLANRNEEWEEILSALIFAGDLEKERSGDLFFDELAAFYASNGAKKADSLSRAQQSLQRGYQLCLKGDYDDAVKPFEDAQAIFQQQGNKLEGLLLDYWRAYCFTQQGELSKSTAILRSMRSTCERRRYRWLEGQSLCWLANNSGLLGEYSRSVEEDRIALRIATDIGDLYNHQKTSAQLAEDYKVLGRLREALEYNQSSLPSDDAFHISYRQFWRSLFSTTDTLFALRLFEAARAYQQEALQLAVNRFQDPALSHDSYVRLAQIYAGQRDFVSAEQSLELSIKMLEPIRNDAIGKKLFGLSMLEMGNIKQQAGEYHAALISYELAQREFGASQYGLYNYRTHRSMLLCHLFLKDDEAIQKGLPIALKLYEQNRRAIREEESRNHFFEAESDVYELAIEYERGRGNMAESFNYAEFSRARSLQDAMIAGTSPSDESPGSDVVLPAVSQPLTLDQLQERLPADCQLVEYAVLQKRILIWVITKTSFELIEQEVTSESLEAVAGEYLSAITTNDPQSSKREQELASQLHDWLIAPIEGKLNKEHEVVIVPDRGLFRIPFAALRSSQTHRRAVRDYTLLYSPSATVLVLCSELALTKAQDKLDERVLSVGDPAFDRTEHHELSRLESAGREARSIASLYRYRAPLIGAEALKKLIELELPRADVIHFATHYLVDDFSPGRSKLLLTSTGNDEFGGADTLSLREIQAMRLTRSKLAILSACRSGIERYYAGEGVIGLSRAFLGAGVPLVVASQWPVETESTEDLMVEFHRLRKVENLPTSSALRRAALHLIEGGRYAAPYYWAAFFAVGGHASY
jgi:CHAT domain-containing protein/Tfp pilus assembly protein PilF